MTSEMVWQVVSDKYDNIHRGFSKIKYKILKKVMPDLTPKCLICIKNLLNLPASSQCKPKSPLHLVLI